jgi:ComF family protein
MIEPPYCARCGLPYAGNITDRFVCANCKELEPFFSHARSAVRLTDLVLGVIARYKYQRALWFEPFLIELLLTKAVPELAQASWSWIVPVPLHPAREREREFNQAARLAAPLSGATGIPLNARLLKRVEYSQTQTMLDRHQRAANVRRAFAMRTSAPLVGERIVLVDDVLTTGATTSACARTLREAGAGEVCVWTVARATLTT